MQPRTRATDPGGPDMDNLLIPTIALAIVAILANLAVSFGEDSRDGFGWSGPAGLS